MRVRFITDLGTKGYVVYVLFTESATFIRTNFVTPLCCPLRCCGVLRSCTCLSAGDNISSASSSLLTLTATVETLESMSATDRPMKIALGSNDDASSGVKYFAMQCQISKSVLSTEVEDDMTLHPVNVLMVGSGEYTTGYVDGKASDSDKGAGVVALTMFDLRRRGKVNHLAIVGKTIHKRYCRSITESVQLSQCESIMIPLFQFSNDVLKSNYGTEHSTRI